MNILFVCVENSCRSQMAEGFAKAMMKGIEVFSAGSKPSGVVNPYAIKVMLEVGIDISFYRSKGFDALPYREFDYIVTMGCKDTCPFFPSKETLDWQIEDPKGKDIQYFRIVRDKIKIEVDDLIRRLKIN